MLALLPPTTLALGLAAAAPRPVALYTSELCLQHDPGKKFGVRHPEQPARLGRLLEAARGPWAAEFGELLEIREPEADVTRAQLEAVHTEQHIQRVERLFEQTRRPPGVRCNLAGDTVVCPTSEPAVMRAAGLVCAAVDDAVAAPPPARRAFVMVRPPGHHAEASRGGGFCVFNNVVVGAAHAQRRHGVGRVAILDFDVHHGNGGEDLSFCDPTRMYVSSHEAGNYACPGVESRCDGLHGQVLSCPLPPASGSAAFRAAWRDVLLPAVEAFEPEMLFVSAGFDAHRADALSDINLEDDDYEWISREVARLGGGELPLISVLEGGYNVEQLPHSVHAHLSGLIHA
jgi:acetoin utilization deacetylase AcuC-like enzyme